MLISQSNCTPRLRALSHASIVSWPTTTLLSDNGMDCSDADEPNHIMLVLAVFSCSLWDPHQSATSAIHVFSWFTTADACDREACVCACVYHRRNSDDWCRAGRRLRPFLLCMQWKSVVMTLASLDYNVLILYMEIHSWMLTYDMWMSCVHWCHVSSVGKVWLMDEIGLGVSSRRNLCTD